LPTVNTYDINFQLEAVIPGIIPVITFLFLPIEIDKYIALFDELPLICKSWFEQLLTISSKYIMLK